jgi:phosphoribosylformylglycinamidine synthase PurS subunit
MRRSPLKAKVHITLKSGVLDPQGKAVEHALGGLGFKDIIDVRQGKYIELTLKTKDKAKAKAEVEKMCKTLLANTVIENYTVEMAE